MAADIVAERPTAVAFRDLAPIAATHVLVVPRKHIASIGDLTDDDRDLAHDLLQLCGEVARVEQITGTGYRVVANTGEDAGQTVQHLHLHVIGGQPLGKMG